MTMHPAMRAVLLSCIFLLLLPSCKEKEGPAEKAGEKIDEAVEKAKESVENAGDKIEDATDRVTGKTKE